MSFMVKYIALSAPSGAGKTTIAQKLVQKHNDMVISVSATTRARRPGEQDGPIRTCVGCRERRPQRDLVRCVLDADGSVRIDRDAPGRGAWLCGAECLDAARRRRGFDRAFRRPIDPTRLESLESDLTG